MEFEPWMLLAFPLFFGMGWLAARMDIKQLVDESSALPRSYFQGLQFLLDEQQDKAIDAFIEVVSVDPQTVDLHFALGSLFRRRGEVDRALRMHLNLAERVDLDPNRKEQARFELAQDYLKAGILDRAESIFLDLQNTPYARQALEFLLETYQKEHDWLKAADITQRLTALTNEPHAKEAAFFYCELADEDIAHQRPEAAQAHLEQALDTWPHLTRAIIMQGDIERAAGNPLKAIETWQQIEQHDPKYLPLVAERLLEAYRESDQLDAGIAVLRGYLTKHHSLDLMNVVSEAVLERDGPEVAYQIMRDELQANPTLLGLDRLLETRLRSVGEERRSDVELVRKLLHQRTNALSMYRCSACGFKARQFYWHCPACYGWETYAPRHTEENGDLP